MRIGLITGFWSTNIGNAFFHLGADWLLRSTASKDDEIIWLNNMPAYWRIFNKKNPTDAVRGIGEPFLDVLVMVGPFLRSAFPDIWADEVKRLKSNGTRVVMLGLGAMQHDQQTREACRAWFSMYRPDFMATRDFATFQVLDGLGLNVEHVICPAFFVSDAVRKPSGDVMPYVVMNCEKIEEPSVELVNSTGGDTSQLMRLGVDHYEVQPRAISGSSYLERFAEAKMGIRHLFFGSRSLTTLGDVPIFRTVHRSNPFILRNLFSKPNTMLSDVPHPYLLAYANAEYVITDRVHTAVACISYGTPVYFVGKTKREGLLQPGGATTEASGLLSIDREKLNSAKSRLSAIVVKHIYNR